jgi:hypothetical protein
MNHNVKNYLNLLGFISLLDPTISRHIVAGFSRETDLRSVTYSLQKLLIISCSIKCRRLQSLNTLITTIRFNQCTLTRTFAEGPPSCNLTL